MGLWFYGQNSQYFTNDLFQSFNVSRKSYKQCNSSGKIVDAMSYNSVLEIEIDAR